MVVRSQRVAHLAKGEAREVDVLAVLAVVVGERDRHDEGVRRRAVLGAQLLKGPHRQPPREKPSAHGPPQPVTLGTPGSPAEPPHVRAVSPAATAPPGTTHAKCGGGITFESLQLNQAAQELWGCWGNGSDVPAVMLTFGSHSMADFLLNWLEHVKRLDQRLYLVGALDQRMEQAPEIMRTG